MSARRSGWFILSSLCCAVVLAFAAPAGAQETARARLLTAPDAQILSDNFPVVALATGVSGRAVLSCAVQADGSSECAAVEETPQGMGFGAAAVELARDWQFSPRVANGAPVASTSRVTLEFQSESDGAQIIEQAISVDGTIGVTPEANTTDENAAWYPTQAHASGVGGRVLVACAVRSSGARDCAIEREAPGGLGFGERAVALISDMLARRGELEAGTVFRVPVDFAMHAAGEPVRRMHWEGPHNRTRDNFTRYYPREALERERNGHALLSCLIQAQGTLNCEMVSETPAGFGFGRAALEMARDQRLSPTSLGLPGLAVGDRILMPMNFWVEGGH